MAATRKPPPDPLLAEHVAAQCRQLVADGARLCVGLSGGADSVALLHLLIPLRNRYRLSAVHVHHGLSPHADDWARFCTRLCEQFGLPLYSHRLHIDPADPRGTEAAAREGRTGIFAGLPVDAVALGHHRDDQAETVLLQLLRGAGPGGLAAMPAQRTLPGGVRLVRPLLETNRAQLRAWAGQQRLEWVEDESNADLRFTRNAIRHRLAPVLDDIAPAWRTTLARSARHMADAKTLLDEEAARDLIQISEDRRLNCLGLAALGDARGRNVLRHFLAGHGLDIPDTARLDDMHRQLTQAGRDAHLRVALGDRVLHVYRGQAQVVRDRPAPSADAVWHWRGETSLLLTELGGRLVFEPTPGRGLRLPADGALEIRPRRGGENLQPDCRRPRRPVKKWLQESAIPSWQRPHLPFVWHNGQLVHVAGIGTDCTKQAAAGETGLVIHWLPTPD